MRYLLLLVIIMFNLNCYAKSYKLPKADLSGIELPNIDFSKPDYDLLGIKPDFENLDPRLNDEDQIKNISVDERNSIIEELDGISKKQDDYQFNDSFLPQRGQIKDDKLCYKKVKKTNDIKICYEGKGSSNITCYNNINLETKYKPAVIEQVEHFQCIADRNCAGEQKWRKYVNLEDDDVKCPQSCRSYYTTNQITQNAQLDSIQRTEYNSCDPNFIKGCQIINEVCLDQEIKEFDGKIYNECWKKKTEYYCGGSDNNGCESIKSDTNCTQISSECSEKEGGICVTYEQKYNCQTNESNEEDYECIDTPDTTDFVPEKEEDTDFAKSISTLSALSQFNENGDGNIGLFRGELKSCHKTITDVVDCCNLDGWGDNVKIGSCNESEKELYHLRSNQQCVAIDSKCSSSFLGKCTEKQESFCCYDSKLAKVFQEQAHQQLNIDWHGDKPCRSLLIESEVKTLDFEQLDLTPAFDSISEDVKLPNPKKLKEKYINNIGDSL